MTMKIKEVDYMKKITKIISLLLVALMLFSFCSCKKSDNKDNGSDITSSGEEQKENGIDVSLNQSIKQSEYSNTEYTVNIPDWEYVGDYYEKTDDKEYDSYNRMYQCKDNKDVYLLVGEYLGWNKIPTGQTPTDYVQASIFFASNLMDSSFPHFFNKKLYEWSIGQYTRSKCDDLPDEDRAGRYTGTIIGKDFENGGYKDGVAYVKGVCFIAGDTQVNFGFLDLTKDQLYQDELDQAVTDVSMSFTYGKLVIQEEDDPFAN